jgi:cell fate (sporulation/competence/biofilm development) regulator YlbF (YheA/YmcA/DUF963 family)
MDMDAKHLRRFAKELEEFNRLNELTEETQNLADNSSTNELIALFITLQQLEWKNTQRFRILVCRLLILQIILLAVACYLLFR